MSMNLSLPVPTRKPPRGRRWFTSTATEGVDALVQPPAAPPRAEMPPMSLDEIMASPARRLMPRLHPKRPNRPKDVWFSIDDCIRNDITLIYQNDFKGPWRSISKFPPEDQVQWWSKFAQRYYWESGHHDVVVRSYRNHLKDLLKNNISKGKTNNKRPAFVDPDNWDIMLQYWATSPAKKKSKQCSDAKKSQREGFGHSGHTNGSKSFNKTVHEMADANDGVMPSIPELIKKTHTKADGTFVDKFAEKVCVDVQRLASQMSTPNTNADSETDDNARSDVTNISTEHLNKAFFEYVPLSHGYRFGMG